MLICLFFFPDFCKKDGKHFLKIDNRKETFRNLTAGFECFKACGVVIGKVYFLFLRKLEYNNYNFTV